MNRVVIFGKPYYFFSKEDAANSIQDLETLKEKLPLPFIAQPNTVRQAFGRYRNDLGANIVPWLAGGSESPPSCLWQYLRSVTTEDTTWKCQSDSITSRLQHKFTLKQEQVDIALCEINACIRDLKVIYAEYSSREAVADAEYQKLCNKWMSVNIHDSKKAQCPGGMPGDFQDTTYKNRETGAQVRMIERVLPQKLILIYPQRAELYPGSARNNLFFSSECWTQDEKSLASWLSSFGIFALPGISLTVAV